jgi:hypothetical protein
MAQPQPQPPKPQSPPKSETPPTNERPRPQQEAPRAQTREQTAQQPPSGAYQVNADAERLAMQAGYPFNYQFQAKLFDVRWWKYLWRALGLPENKLGRHEFTTKNNEQIVIQAYGSQWEQLVCIFHIGQGLSVDDYFKVVFARNVRYWKDPNVRVVYLSSPR